MAKILNMDIFEKPKDSFEMDDVSIRIIKSLKQDLALKDFQIESMKTRLTAIERKNKIFVNNRQIWTNLNLEWNTDVF